MPRDITVTFDDGSSHVYQGAPDDVTPQAVTQRAEKEFSKKVTHLDGGKKPDEKKPKGFFDTKIEQAKGAAKGFAGRAADVVGGIADIVGGTVAPGMMEPGGENTGGPLPQIGAEAAKSAGSALTMGPMDLARKASETLKSTGKKLMDPTGESQGAMGFDVGLGLLGLGELGVVSNVARTAEEATTAAAKKSLPSVVKHHEAAVKASGLPMSEGIGTEGAGLESDIGKVAEATLKDKLSARKAVVDPAWDAFRAKGAELESQGHYFAVDQPEFFDNLIKIETGGESKATEHAAEFRADATKLREALSGMDPSDPLHRPVNLQVVHEELRKLRAKQANAGPLGYDAVTRERYGNLADRLQKSLENWVGKENFPNELHAKMSAEINPWGSTLGQRLAGRQEIDYVPHDQAPEAFTGPKADSIFKTENTVKEASGLLGDPVVKQMAERYVSNNMRFRDASKAAQWYERNKAWIRNYPDLDQKTLKYLGVLATRQRNVKVLKYVGGVLGTGAVGIEGYRLVSGQ